MRDHELLENLIATLNIGTVVVDSHCRIQLWNRFMEVHSGKPADQVMGRNLCEVAPELPHEWFHTKLRSVACTGQPAYSRWSERPWLFRFRNPRSLMGGPEWMYQDCTFLPLGNHGNEPLPRVGLTVMDVTDTAAYQQKLQRAQLRLTEMSIRDPLTGISNRRHLEDRLAEEFERARRYGLPLSVVMFDIDHFKRVNDRLGHQSGDEVIRCIARLAQTERRASDTLGRYGGEEFTMVLPETPLHGAETAARRLCDTVAATAIPVGSGPVHTTISAGVAAMRATDNSKDHLLDRADTALYEAKARGRNRIATSGAARGPDDGA